MAEQMIDRRWWVVEFRKKHIPASMRVKDTLASNPGRPSTNVQGVTEIKKADQRPTFSLYSFFPRRYIK